MFVAFSGAQSTDTFEPSASSYEVLLKNIRFNELDSIIQAKRFAVVGRPCAPVKFPRSSNVMNAIMPDSSESNDYDLVPTIPLSEIVLPLNSVDNLKSDYERGGYDIPLQTGEEDIRKIVEIRMEIHRGQKSELISRLVGLGYKIREDMNEDTGAGYIWMNRGSTA